MEHNKPFFQRYGQWLALAVMLGWNGLLVFYRMHITGKIFFVFLLWNLFLALAPYLSSQAGLFLLKRRHTWPAVACLLLAVLFLPNAPYIITDLFHLRARADMPLWFDTMVIFSLAASGLVLFYLTLFDLSSAMQRSGRLMWTELVVFIICLLCGFGIYLGRYLRFNSWDMLSNPEPLLDEIADRLINPSRHTRTVGVTLLYGMFLYAGYGAIRLFHLGKKQVQ